MCFLLLKVPVLGWIRRAVQRRNLRLDTEDDVFGLANLYRFSWVVFILFHLPTPSLVKHRARRPVQQRNHLSYGR
jgi:hypothetical protein